MHNIFNTEYLLFLSDLPPPPPEAFDEPEDDDGRQNVQSRTFKVLQDVVEHGGEYRRVFLSLIFVSICWVTLA